MSVNAFKISKIFKKAKEICIFILLISALFFNYFFHEIYFLIRFIVVFLLCFTAAVLFLYTRKGTNIFFQIKMLYKEINKITWPKYQETLYTTLVIILVTILVSLFLWILDNVIFRLITFIISLRL